MQGQRLRPPELALGDDPRRRKLDGPVIAPKRRFESALESDAIDPFDKIHEPMAAMILTIRTNLQPRALLQFDGTRNRLLFKVPQRLPRQLALGKPGARVEQALGAQQRTDDISLERRHESGLGLHRLNS